MNSHTSAVPIVGFVLALLLTAGPGAPREGVAQGLTPPLPFVALAPCRLVDTRGNGFGGAFGPPALASGVARDFPLAGRCGIPADALAVSLNVTAVDADGPGFLMLGPAGGALATVSTLNYLGGQTVANAALAPLGPGGLTVVAGVSGTDLILDVNGYFVDAGASAGGDITAVTAGAGLAGGGTSGAVTLGLQSCPSGQVLKATGPDAWACAADANSGGTLTGVTAGAGLTGGGTTGTVAVSLATPVAVASGGTGATTAAGARANLGAGTVVSVDSGFGLSGGPITTSGTLAVDPTVVQQRVTGACAGGSAANAINGDGTVGCQTLWTRGGNTGTTAGTDFLGTTDNQALELKVNGQPAWRLQPQSNGTYGFGPNVVGGSGGNSVTGGAVGPTVGATIGGGGSATGCGVSGTSPCVNSVTVYARNLTLEAQARSLEAQAREFKSQLAELEALRARLTDLERTLEARDAASAIAARPRP